MTELRILQIAHDHPDWTRGGTEIVAHDLTRALDRQRGVSARFLAVSTALQRPGAVPGSLAAQGGDFVIATGAYDRFTMLRQDGTAWLAALAQVAQVVRPDIVHLHGLDRIGAEVIPALRRIVPHARLVLTLHDYQLVCANDGLLLTVPEGARCAGAANDRCARCFPQIPAARHALRRAHLLALLDGVDVMIAPSRFLRDAFIAWGIAPERIRHIRNAVAVAPGPAGDQPRARRNRFAFMGNIAAHKGVLVVLDAAARIAAADDDLRIVLHGGLGWADDAFRAEFGVRLAAAGPVAQHLGPYDRADVGRLMRQADWIVVPSLWWENAPLVILEAQAAGRPVIASDIGGMAELVADGVNGLHVPAGDAAALAECLRSVADDAALWARLAANVTAQPYQAHVDAHLALYRSLHAVRPAGVLA